MINLSGIATSEDNYIYNRFYFDDAFNQNFKQSNAQEILDELIEQIKEPEPAPPNLRDPETFKKYFEERNKHLGLYYTKWIMDQFYELYDDIQFRIGSTQLNENLNEQ